MRSFRYSNPSYVLSKCTDGGKYMLKPFNDCLLGGLQTFLSEHFTHKFFYGCVLKSIRFIKFVFLHNISSGSEILKFFINFIYYLQCNISPLFQIFHLSALSLKHTSMAFNRWRRICRPNILCSTKLCKHKYLVKYLPIPTT